MLTSQRTLLYDNGAVARGMNSAKRVTSENRATRLLLKSCESRQSHASRPSRKRTSITLVRYDYPSDRTI